MKSEAGKQLVEKMENNQQKEKKTVLYYFQFFFFTYFHFYYFIVLWQSTIFQFFWNLPKKFQEKPADPEAIIKPFMQLKPRPVFRSNTFKDYK